jgi:pimeloyl-ACP methyl ester carboxylesterase
MLSSRERGAGHPVLLLHGQPGTADTWDPLVDLIAPDFAVHAVDRPGYGATGGAARGVAANADMVAEYLDARTGGPATVVAHSWSGGVAVLLARQRPDLVSNLVLVGAACTPDSLDLLDRLLTVSVVGSALTAAGLVGIDALLPRVRRWSRYAPERYREQLRAVLPDQSVLGGPLTGGGSFRNHRQTFMTEQQALIDELPAVTAALPALDLPVSVVSGEWDVVVRPQAAVSLAAAVSNAELVLVPNAGHFVARDAPEVLADAVVRAWRDLGQPDGRGDRIS